MRRHDDRPPVALGDAVDAYAVLPRAGCRPVRRSPERSYFNFSERPIDGARLYPTETYRRLRAIKTAYDSCELFASNHPIPSFAGTDSERAARAGS